MISLLTCESFLAGRALERHHDTLCLKPAFKGIFTLCATNPRSLISTKWRSSIKVVIHVNPDSTSTDLMCSGYCTCAIGGTDAGTKAIHGTIGTLNHFLVGFELQNRHDGSKNLFLCNDHIVFDICKNCGLDKIPLVAETTTPTSNRCTLFFPLLNVTKNLVKLKTVDLWSLFDPFILRLVLRVGTDLDAFDFLDSCLHKFIIYALLNEQSTSGAAALTLIQE
mmetsp:Transcript_17492/g.25714  ORF Transcript_17492/g.25714 Transcript_17492/m.25714 type:complete len:223 (+) Transcript_17492:357-1025(+)